MFIQNCFIHKNTKELCEKLNEIGYRVLPNLFGMVGLSTMTNGICVPSVSNERDNGYDCGENEHLFLAIAAIRDDTDKYQLFFQNEDIKCKYPIESIHEKFHHICVDTETLEYIDHKDEWHKGTVEELIKHFVTCNKYIRPVTKEVKK